MVPSYSLVIWLPKTPKSHQSPIAPSSRKLWFSEDTQFWPKYSNGPGVAKSWQISKVTIRCHKRCLKLSWVQIWQKNSNGKCPKLPIRSAHSLRYIGGLSVNLNHLKTSISKRAKNLGLWSHWIWHVRSMVTIKSNSKMECFRCSKSESFPFLTLKKSFLWRLADLFFLLSPRVYDLLSQRVIVVLNGCHSSISIYDVHMLKLVFTLGYIFLNSHCKCVAYNQLLWPLWDDWTLHYIKFWYPT